MGRRSNKGEEILEFINTQIKKTGIPPSVREICHAVGLTSTSTVHAHLKKLELQGLLLKDPAKNRSIRPVDMSMPMNYDENFLDVPIIGRVTAGNPILAVEEHTGTFKLPLDFAKNKDLFMLKVQGDSMINAAILDGDFVIVQSQSVADNGDIVVALIDDSATVKTFYKENGHFRLQPENDALEPIIVPDVSILGKVVGVFRQF